VQSQTIGEVYNTLLDIAYGTAGEYGLIEPGLYEFDGSTLYRIVENSPYSEIISSDIDEIVDAFGVYDPYDFLNQVFRAVDKLESQTVSSRAQLGTLLDDIIDDPKVMPLNHRKAYDAATLTDFGFRQVRDSSTVKFVSPVIKTNPVSGAWTFKDNAGNVLLSGDASTSYVSAVSAFATMAISTLSSFVASRYGVSSVVDTINAFRTVHNEGRNFVETSLDVLQNDSANTDALQDKAIDSLNDFIFSLPSGGVGAALKYLYYGFRNSDVRFELGFSKGIVSGSSHNDRFMLTGFNDKFNAQGGNDVAIGRGGNDSLLGGNGSDSLFGGDGSDTVKGNAGGDVLYGGASADSLAGGSENDKMYGDGGADRMDGGTGRDVVSGGPGNDRIFGGDQADRLYGGFGKDTLGGGGGGDKASGGADNDTLYGGWGNDALSGDGGNDLIYGQTGNDTIAGGAGNDTAAFSGGIGRYEITQLASNKIKVVDTKGTYGTDILYGIETLKFGSKTYKASDAVSSEPPTPSNTTDDLDAGLIGATASTDYDQTFHDMTPGWLQAWVLDDGPGEHAPASQLFNFDDLLA